MKVLFNGNLIDEPIPWSSHDRAFQYGDGFFETMLWTEGNIPLLENHLERVMRSASAFHFDLPENELRFIEENADTLIQLNEIESPQVKVKLMIWRRAGQPGGYRTRERHVNWAVTVTASDRPSLKTGIRLDVSKTVRIAVFPWSGAKSMSAQPYVMASFECGERGLDDLIICNTEGMIAECIESNIFWRENDTWYTPSVESGCVRGVMRDHITEVIRAEGKSVNEVLAIPDEVSPDEAFTCNALHLGSISEWCGKKLTENTDRLDAWFSEIKNPVT